MKLLTLATSLILPAFILAQGEGDICYPKLGAHPDGICHSHEWCRIHHGSAYPGNCPGAPSDLIRCCEAPQCNGPSSYCTSDGDGCAGEWIKGLCPGPANYKCCSQ